MRKLLSLLLGSLLVVSWLAPTSLALRFPSADELFGQDQTEEEVDPNSQFSDDELNDERNRRNVPLPKGDLFKDIFPQVVSLVLYGMGVIIFIVLSYAGVRLVISRGDEEIITRMKELVIHMVIGVIIVGAAFGLVAGVIRVFANL